MGMSGDPRFEAFVNKLISPTSVQLPALLRAFLGARGLAYGEVEELAP